MILTGPAPTTVPCVEGTPGRTVAAQFAADPAAVVADLLRRAGRPQGAITIKGQLVAAGVSAAEVDRVWPGTRWALTARPDVVITGRSYAWRAPDPADVRRQLEEL